MEELIKKITSIPSGYFQKSLFFLYPVLGIPQNVKPVNTYILTDLYQEDIPLLICVYDSFISPDQVLTEKKHLFGHDLFKDYITRKDQRIFVFDFSKFKNNLDVFKDGEYSRFSPFIKNKILTYYQADTATKNLAHCYLNPTLYYETFSELLDVDICHFSEYSELASPPDLEKETLNLKK